MRLAHAVRVGSWVLVGLNLLMAVGTIAVFSRMAPAIEVILDRNERTLQACEDMLAILAVVGDGSRFSKPEEQEFRRAFKRAQDNITEDQEPVALAQIEHHLQPLLAGDTQIRSQSVNAIIHLGKINRDAMTLADQHAQHLGRNGAWGVAFMAISVFLAGVVFIRSLTRRVVTPLEEIHTVINANRNGDTMRRCTGVDLAQDVSAVFTGINEILDQHTTVTHFASGCPVIPPQLAPLSEVTEEGAKGADESSC
ncbi:MAG: hypothetical protein PHI97_06580 [Desulfobulbus sp.]|nr:hypothetical protein [Desulfobulbus sp.]